MRIRVAVPWKWGSSAIRSPQPARKRERDPGSFHVDIALRADPLTAFMLVTVTFVSLLVAVYSIGYMHGDPGYWRFFSYIALFVFSMTMLVSASNFVLLYVFWEAVGPVQLPADRLLVQKPAAAAAGKKAFLVNRVGDFGFALGVFLIWTTYGTLDFHERSFGRGHPRPIPAARRAVCRRRHGHGDLPAAVAGGVRQERQFPLHVWLPDAMEGPTPVSRADPRGHDGHGRRVPGGPLHAAVSASPDARHVVAVHRRDHGPAGRADRPRRRPI